MMNLSRLKGECSSISRSFMRYSKENGKRDRGICCVLAILVLFAGMCLEIAKADSLFVSDQKSVSVVYNANAYEWSDCEFSTAEMSGVRSTAYIASAIRRYSERNTIRLSILWLLTGFLFTKVSDLQKAVETAEAPETRYAAALLRYLQNQDGKK